MQLMCQQTAAVYERGCLTPLTSLDGIPEHAMVRITIESHAITSRDQQLALLREVPVDNEFAEAIEMGRKQPWTVNEF
jgi:hypothetical protein